MTVYGARIEPIIDSILAWLKSAHRVEVLDKVHEKSHERTVEALQECCGNSKVAASAILKQLTGGYDKQTR